MFLKRSYLQKYYIYKNKLDIFRKVYVLSFEIFV